MNIVEYMERRGHLVRRASARAFETYCPFHPQRTPSFWLYPEDDSYHCFSCGSHNYLSGLIGILELGFEDPSLGAHWTSDQWRQAFERARELGHEPQVDPAYAPLPRRRPSPGPEQVRAMEVAGEVYRQGLERWPPAQVYLAQRGLSADAVRLAGLGYAGGPGSLRALVAALRGAFGERWHEVATSIGLLTRDGRERLAGRVYIPERRGDHTLYYQGRAIDPANKLRYVSPPVIHRPLYGLASFEQPVPFGVLVEGPFDAIPLIAEGLAVAACMGDRLTEEAALVKALGDRPLVIALDADGPGEKAVEPLIERLTSARVPTIRLCPPEPFKDLGEWVGGKWEGGRLVASGQGAPAVARAVREAARARLASLTRLDELSNGVVQSQSRSKAIV